MRELSFPDDRLPALSGLAHKMSQTLVDGDYLAGLWRRDLLRGILWTPDTDSPISKPERYRAPSWAWSSLDGRVNFFCDFDYATFRARLLDAEVEISGQDPMGRVAGGRLVLSGELVHISIILQDLALEIPNGIVGKGYRGYALSDLRVDFSSESNIWGMLVVTSDPPGNTRIWHGLLLEKVTEDKNGEECEQFCRFGHFQLRDDWDSSHVPIFSQVRESQIVTII
jgi:hypothetical protein